MDDVPVEGALRVVVEGVEVCVVNSGGRLFALVDECSHGKVRLSEGEVCDGVVECYLHGSQFDLVTGRPLCLPATEPVPVFEVRVEGDTVEIAL